MSQTPMPTATPPRSLRRRWAVIAGTAVAVLAVLAVAYTAFTPSPAPPGAPGAAPSGFMATTASGQSVPVPGGKPSAVLFFSATCGSCGPAAHALAQAQHADAHGANTYAVVDMDPSESPQTIRAFLAANQASTLPVARDTNAALTGAYQVTALSTAVILGPDGRAVARTVEPTVAQIQQQLATASTP